MYSGFSSTFQRTHNIFLSQQISISIIRSQILVKQTGLPCSHFTEIWLMLMLMLICCERKTLCARWKVLMKPESNIFLDRGSNSLSHVKSEQLVSYSKFPCEQLKFVAKPIVLAAIHSPSFPSICIAASTACAQKIAAHLCRLQQRQLALGPPHFTDHLGVRLVAA